MNKEQTKGVWAVQSARQTHPFEGWLHYTPLAPAESSLYAAMREAVPIIDAAIDKILRLIGGFRVECGEPGLQRELEEFVNSVPVGASSRGLHQFVAIYLDSLLTYGNAVGEIVLNREGRDILALYNAKLDDVRIRQGATPLETEICASVDGVRFEPVKYPQLILFTPLNPPAGEIRGVSILRSLPFVTSILLKIFSSTGQNFERIANLRYAVTYKPGTDGDKASAQDVAQMLAKEWGDAMDSQKNGVVKDFVAVGDVDVKVIGADNRMIDTQVPVRQMLEQIVARLGVPPFMLGLHWSSTERMSAQQADILTSELESYRRLMEGVLVRICGTWLRLRGSSAKVGVEWDDINLQDEVETANARYLNAQAAALEKETKGVIPNG